MEHREQMAHEGRKPHPGHIDFSQLVAAGEVIGQTHRDSALTGIADQGQRGSASIAGAQHIGCPWIARSVGMRISQTHEPADHHREGDGADQIGQAHAQQRSIVLNVEHDQSSRAQSTAEAWSTSVSTAGSRPTRNPRRPPLIQMRGRSSTVRSTNTGMRLRTPKGEVPPT